MIWIVLAILVVGYFIVRAINKAANPPVPLTDYEVQDMNDYHDTTRRLNARGEIDKVIFHLGSSKHLSDEQIANDPTVKQLYEIQRDKNDHTVLDEKEIKTLKRDARYLSSNKFLLVRLKQFLDKGYDDSKIAKELFKPNDKGSLGRWLDDHDYGYTAEDIKKMRTNVLTKGNMERLNT